MLRKNIHPFLRLLMNNVTAKQIHIIRLNQHGKHCGLIMRIFKMSGLLTSDVLWAVLIVGQLLELTPSDWNRNKMHLRKNRTLDIKVNYKKVLLYVQS